MTDDPLDPKVMRVTDRGISVVVQGRCFMNVALLFIGA